MINEVASGNASAIIAIAPAGGVVSTVVGLVGTQFSHGRGGKLPKLSPTQEAHLVTLYRAGEHTVSELEELLAVTGSTIYGAVARA